MGFWDIEILIYWDIGILRYWDIGILRYSDIEICNCKCNCNCNCNCNCICNCICMAGYKAGYYAVCSQACSYLRAEVGACSWLLHLTVAVCSICCWHLYFVQHTVLCIVQFQQLESATFGESSRRSCRSNIQLWWGGQ